MARYRQLGTALATCLVAGCSFVLDLDGLEPPASADASIVVPSGTSGSSGGDASLGANDGAMGTSSGSSASSSSGDAMVTDPAACDHFRVSVKMDDSDGDPSYFPGSGLAVRKSSPEVIVIGQYEPENKVSTLIVDNRTTPHVLVLASYGSTTWKVVAKVPAAVSKVVLSGYEASSVEGVPGSANEEQGPWTDSYPSSDATELLSSALPKVGGKDMSAFAGGYALIEVTIDDACSP